MSLINDMLRNLEERHAANSPLPNEVRPLPSERKGLPLKPVAAAVLLVVACVGGWLALRDGDPPAQPAAPAPVRQRPAAAPLPPPPVSEVVPAPPAPSPSPAPAMPSPEPLVAAAAPTVQLPKVPLSNAPPPAVPAVPALAAEPAKPVSTEKRQKLQTLRLATDLLPSMDRLKSTAATVSAMPPAPAGEKAAGEADATAQAEADLRRARALLGQGARAEAEQAFKLGLAKLPAQTNAAMTLARLQIDRNDAAAAWETLHDSLPHARDQAAYRAFCGTVLQRLNRSREAVEHYQAALRLNPAEGRWWVGLGLSLEGAGQAAEAREAFQRARAAGNLPPEMAAFAEQKAR